MRLADIDCEEVVVGAIRVPVEVFFEVVEVRVASDSVITRSRAAWWDFNPGLLMLTASVTFADAFGCRLSCSGTHADIGAVLRQ